MEVSGGCEGVSRDIHRSKFGAVTVACDGASMSAGAMLTGRDMGDHTRKPCGCRTKKPLHKHPPSLLADVWNPVDPQLTPGVDSGMVGPGGGGSEGLPGFGQRSYGTYPTGPVSVASRGPFNHNPKGQFGTNARGIGANRYDLPNLQLPGGPMEASKQSFGGGFVSNNAAGVQTSMSAVLDITNPRASTCNAAKSRENVSTVAGDAFHLGKKVAIAAVLITYYVVYAYLQLVYYGLRSLLFFHNADGPMKLTIAIVAASCLMIGYHILYKIGRIFS